MIPLSPPEIIFKHGRCCAAIFAKEIRRGDKKFLVRNVSFQKHYRDRNGEWQSTSTLDVNDIPKAVLVLSKAYDYLTSGDHRDEEKEGQ